MEAKELIKKYEAGDRDFNGENFWRAELRGVNLSGASFECANFNGAILRNTKLKGVNLQNANLPGADLRNACLWGADLKGANFRNADLQNADFRGANIKDANLGGANTKHTLFGDVSPEMVAKCKECGTTFAMPTVAHCPKCGGKYIKPEPKMTPTQDFCGLWEPEHVNKPAELADSIIDSIKSEINDICELAVSISKLTDEINKGREHIKDLEELEGRLRELK